MSDAAFLAAINAHPGDPGPVQIFRDYLEECGRWTWPEVLALVRADPADDAPRLTAALWQEREGDRNYAEFIRTQFALARAQDGYDRVVEEEPTARSLWRACSGRIRLERREHALWNGLCLPRDRRSGGPPGPAQPRPGFPTHWFEIPGWGAHCPPDRCEIRYAPPGRCDLPEIAPLGVARRGFVEEVVLPAPDWLGGPCCLCDGRGYDPAGVSPPQAHHYLCPHCLGQGELLAHHPIRRVLFTTWAAIERVRDADGRHCGYRLPGFQRVVAVAGPTPCVRLAVAEFPGLEIEWPGSWVERVCPACGGAFDGRGVLPNGNCADCGPAAARSARQ